MDRLLEALQIPDSNTSYQGSVFTGMESLMVLLRRLSYPNRWCDLVPIFGRTEPELSMAFDMSVMAPNGIIAHLFGPIEGRRHDAFMLGESNLLPLLDRMVKPNGA